MSFQLRALADMQQLRLERKVPSHRDASSLDKSLRWGYSTDLLDPTPFLDGHELILTTAQQLRAGDGALEERCRAYVDRLVEGDAAGIVYTLAQPDDELSDALFATCRERSMPLFEAPFDIPFLRIVETIAAHNDATAQAQASHVAHAQHALTLAGLSADPITAIVRELAVITGLRVVIEDANGQPIAKSPGTSDRTTIDETKARHVPLGIGQRSNGQLIVVPAEERSSSTKIALKDGSKPHQNSIASHTAVINLAAAMLHLAVGANDRIALDLLRQRAVDAVSNGQSKALLKILQQLVNSSVQFPIYVELDRRRRGKTSTLRTAKASEVQDEIVCSIGRGAQSIVLRWGAKRNVPPVKGTQARWKARTPAELVLACRAAWTWIPAGRASASPSHHGAGDHGTTTRKQLTPSGYAQAAKPSPLPYLAVLLDVVHDDPLLRELARDQRMLVRESLGDHAQAAMGMVVAWVDAGCSWNGAAQKMGVHRTTVERQVRQIGQVLEIDIMADGGARQWAYLICCAAQ